MWTPIEKAPKDKELVVKNGYGDLSVVRWESDS